MAGILRKENCVPVTISEDEYNKAVSVITAGRIDQLNKAIDGLIDLLGSEVALATIKTAMKKKELY